jgi:hypothetical protein
MALQPSIAVLIHGTESLFAALVWLLIVGGLLLICLIAFAMPIVFFVKGELQARRLRKSDEANVGSKPGRV